MFDLPLLISNVSHFQRDRKWMCLCTLRVLVILVVNLPCFHMADLAFQGCTMQMEVIATVQKIIRYKLMQNADYAMSLPVLEERLISHGLPTSFYQFLNTQMECIPSSSLAEEVNPFALLPPTILPRLLT